MAIVKYRNTVELIQKQQIIEVQEKVLLADLMHYKKVRL